MSVLNNCEFESKSTREFLFENMKYDSGRNVEFSVIKVREYDSNVRFKLIIPSLVYLYFAILVYPLTGIAVSGYSWMKLALRRGMRLSPPILALKDSYL